MERFELSLLFASFYLVPFAFALLIFAALWRSIRSFDLSLAALRFLFVGIATLFFAPMIVPAGTIVTAWVPHAVLMVTPSLAYYLYLPEYIFPSFALTGLVTLLAAMWIIRERPEPRGVGWQTWSYPLLAVAAAFIAFRMAFPDQDIPSAITKAAVERVYGADIDEVIALHRIDDAAAQQSAIEKLTRRFSEDDAVLHVTLEDPGFSYGVYGQVFFFRQDGLSPSSQSCTGSQNPEQKGLAHCSWRGGGADRRHVIQYTRRFTLGDETLTVEFQFDMKALEASLRAATAT